MIPDNRIKLQPTEVDFVNDVGVTGQQHDHYPSPDSAPRYDWMRLYLIGLLSNQSSIGEQPLNFRDGTLWYDKETGEYKYHDSDNEQTFMPLANGIKIDTTSLSNIIDDLRNSVGLMRRTATFSGVSNIDTNIINIPSNIQEVASESDNYPILYKNGLLIDPRLVSFSEGCPVCIELEGDAELEADDKFTIFIQRFNIFHTETIIIN